MTAKPLTVAEWVKLTSISRATLYIHISSGQLPSAKLGSTAPDPAPVPAREGKGDRTNFERSIAMPRVPRPWSRLDRPLALSANQRDPP